MSEYAEGHRKAMKEKARRLAGGKLEGAIDAAGWSPEHETEPLNTETKLGMRPVSKRAFKRGGHVPGAEAYRHAGRAKRKSGGTLTANGLINRDVKEANRERPGGKDHVGGYKHGGKLKKAEGGSLGHQVFLEGEKVRKEQNAAGARYASTHEGAKANAARREMAAEGMRRDPSNAARRHEAIDAGVLKRGGKAKKAGGGPLGGFNAVTDPTVANAVANASQNRAGVAPQRMNFGSAPTGLLHVKRGGRTEHPDEKEDRKLVDKMVKKDALTGRKEGGSAPIYKFGDAGPLSWPKGSAQTYRVERPNGSYVATYADEASARKHAAKEGDYREDAKVIPQSRTGRKEGGGNWIKGAIGHPGALHKELHVPEGEKIPKKKLEKAAHAGGKEGKRARLAETLEHLPHRAHGGRTGKGKMNVNIIIAQPSHGQDGAQQPLGPPPPQQPARPVSVPPTPAAGGMAPQQGAPAAAPAPMPQMPPQGMPRKDGGRAYPLDNASGGGLGRLEKIDAYGLKSPGGH